jgi:hypothetical protein
MDARSERLRGVTAPVSRFLNWVAVSAASSGLLALLVRLPHGPVLAAVALSVAGAAAYEAERGRRWIEIADQVDAVIRDLRQICRAKPVELPAEVQDAMRAIAREEIRAHASGVRVDLEIREDQTEVEREDAGAAGPIKERKP